MTDWVYDIEVFPNVFTCTSMNCDTKKIHRFEISPRKNDITRLKKWMNLMAIKGGHRMVGFNNVGYDYPVLHNLMNLDGSAKYLTHNTYLRSQAIINTPFEGLARFKNRIWDSDVIVPQIDLFLIHHFDNKARATSLKRLQFNMRLKNIDELEFSFNEPIKTGEKLDRSIDYNDNDVYSTYDFYVLSKDRIDFRHDLNQRFPEHNFMNLNDTSLGEKFMTIQIGNKVGQDVLFERNSEGKKVKRKTKRGVMNIGDLIFDTIKFKHPAFNRVLSKLRGMTIEPVKGKFEWDHDENLISCVVDGFQFDVGKGGLHGAQKNSTFISTDEYAIDDRDVTSFYPSAGIEYGLYPQHLTKGFVGVYSGIKKDRLKHKKGTTENAMLKLALNGAYGKTNSEFSVFYDPMYTITTTINGQLMLMMLWDQVRTVPTIQIIQANTDGLTLYYHRDYTDRVNELCAEWEKQTRMVLEQILYKKMYTRDVNNYLCEYEGGGTKEKGAYAFTDLDWSKNFSEMIVPMAASAYLIDGTPIDKFIIEHDDVFDFFSCTNVNKKSKLVKVDRGKDKPLQRTSRYLVSNSGGSLIKIMKPTPKQLEQGKTEMRRIGINADEVVTVVNKVPDGAKPDDYDICYQYYINKAKKLTECFK